MTRGDDRELSETRAAGPADSNGGTPHRSGSPDRQAVWQASGGSAPHALRRPAYATIFAGYRSVFGVSF